jgi:hypothetical protein
MNMGAALPRVTFGLVVALQLSIDMNTALAKCQC